MTWILTYSIAEAIGRLRKSYDTAIARAGRVYGIVRAMSLSADILDSSIGLYRTVMFAREGLTRRQRELLATVVSRINDCHY